MKWAFDQASTLTDRRNEAVRACDVDAFLELRADEFAVVWEVRSTEDKILLTGMTDHEVGPHGRPLPCRE